jgi:hypothetical protein
MNGKLDQVVDGGQRYNDHQGRRPGRPRQSKGFDYRAIKARDEGPEYQISG